MDHYMLTAEGPVVVEWLLCQDELSMLFEMVAPPWRYDILQRLSQLASVDVERIEGAVQALAGRGALGPLEAGFDFRDFSGEGANRRAILLGKRVLSLATACRSTALIRC